MADGCLEIQGRGLFVGHSATVFVGGTINEATFDAAAREDGGIGQRVVVATGVLVDVRCAAKLRPHDHQGGLQQAVGSEILDQRGKHTVHRLSGAAQGLVDVVVHVPAAKLHFNEADAGLYQTARQKSALAEAAVAVFGPGAGGLEREVKDFEVFALHELHGLIVEFGVSFDILRLVFFAEGIVQLVHERDALVEMQLGTGLLDVLQAGLRIRDWDRAGGGREEACAREGAAAIDDDAVRQGDAFDAAQEVGSPGPHAGMHNGATRLIAGFHDVGAGIMHTGLGTHGTHDGNFVGNFRHLGHGAAEVVDATFALDGGCWALGLTGFGIPGVDVGHAAVHPEEDHVLGLAEARSGSCGRRAQVEGWHDGDAEGGLGRAHDEITAGQWAEFVEFGFHGKSLSE